MRAQTLDALAERLPRALKANAEIHHKEFLKCATKLGPQLLRNRVRTETERVGNLIGRARRCTQVHGEKRRHQFATVGWRLDTAVRANLQDTASASCATANASRGCSSAASVA